MYPVAGVPSENGVAGDFARELAMLLGTSISAQDGTVAAAMLLGLGDALSALRSTNLKSADQMFASTANDDGTLTDIEALYGVYASRADSDTVRQLVLLSKVRAMVSGTPQSIASALRSLNGNNTVTISENTAASVAASDPNGVYRFAALVSSTLTSSPTNLARARAIIEQMKPAHTSGSVTPNLAFKCDDSNSLTDLTVLGA